MQATQGAASSSTLNFKTRVFSVIVVLTNVLGNFFLSLGMKHESAALSFSAPWAIVRAIFSPWALLGITLLIVWLLSRMTLLSWADLSYVLPVTSIGYVLTTFIGKYFFAEQISPQRWAGTLLIVAGICLVATTCPRTAPSTLRDET